MQSTYSFLNVQAGLVGPGGVVNLGAGAALADEGITINWLGEVDTMTIGADGEGMHSLRADKSARIVVRLLKTSLTNAVLSLMFNFQRSSGAQHGQNTMSIVDSVRGDVVTCRQVAFAKAPDLAYAADGGMVEWEFNAIKADQVLGSL